MIVKTYEDVMKLKNGDECFIHHPVTNVLLRAVYKSHSTFLRLAQYNSSGLSGNTKEAIATRIANKTFKITSNRRCR